MLFQEEQTARQESNSKKEDQRKAPQRWALGDTEFSMKVKGIYRIGENKVGM